MRLKKLIVSGLVVAIGSLAFASVSLGASHHPTGEFSNFGECPLSRTTIEWCAYSKSSSGSFTIGNKTVPLVNPVTLQGGYEGEPASLQFYGAENGETLSKTPQPVPGGLLGIKAPTWWPEFIQNWFNNLINEGFTGVNATVELLGPSSGLTNIKLNTTNLLFEEGVALGFPARIHLTNAILGSSCYLGSESEPVQLNFTSGVSGSLTGSAGELTHNKEFSFIQFAGGKLVDGTYSAPHTNGCGGIFSFLVNPLVESILGVPAGSGKNSATLEGVIQSGFAASVKASE
ncbi:MAG: hypothetical protein JSS97_03820 [Actinobacteria bacterium]|nr:hypothetical protein [Actinomycetota bacterium]